MTTTTEAMRLALEALELSKEQLAGDRLELIACHAWPAGSGEIPEHDRAGTQALRGYDECLTASDAAITALRDALYTAPPARQALTDEQIDAMWKSFLQSGSGGYIDFARAIERAHGIQPAKGEGE